MRLLTIGVAISSLVPLLSLLWYTSSFHAQMYSYVDATQQRDANRDAELAEMKAEIVRLRMWRVDHEKEDAALKGAYDTFSKETQKTFDYLWAAIDSLRPKPIDARVERK